MDNEQIRIKAIARARRILDDDDLHDDHRHGLVVGVALEPKFDQGAYLAVIAVVQGVDVPCWIALDDDDLARIQALIGARTETTAAMQLDESRLN